MNLLRLAGLLFLLIFNQACNGPEAVNSPEELNKYITDPANGMVKKLGSNDYQVIVQYRPADSFVAQEIGSDPVEFTAEQVEALRNKYSDYTYLVLNVSTTKGNVLYSSTERRHNFSDLLHKLAFRLNEYVNLRSSSGSDLELVDFIYPRLYGKAGTTSVLLVFEKFNPAVDKQIHFQLKEFGLGTGVFECEFITEELLQSPHLQFNL